MEEYIVPYETAEQLGTILDVLRFHNKCLMSPGSRRPLHVRYSEHEAYKLIEPGGELVDAELVRFRPNKWFSSPSHGPALPRGIVFSNDHGHLKTHAFLQWHLLRAFPEVYDKVRSEDGISDLSEELAAEKALAAAGGSAPSGKKSR